MTAGKVLIVDDDREVRDMLAEYLATHGYEVAQADGGVAMRTVLEQGVPDVVLLDIGLPKLNGYEIAKQIRADPALKTTMLVAVTGYGQMQDRALASAAGFDHHLVKPVEFKALQELLRTTAES